MSGSKSFIAAPIGRILTADERVFFADERPWGYILFARNVFSGPQLADLVAELRELGGRPTTPIFIDQEGGRIQRLRPPLAPSYPPAEALGHLYRLHASEGQRAAWLQGRLLADDLAAYGINADCVPCLDVPVEGAHSVIGDRAFATDPQVVATLGRAMADGLVAGGALPVMKHVPGHGRGAADSHLELPHVSTPRSELSRTDFLPFKALNTLPAAMTAHILYRDIDPTRPATLSPIVIDQVIRTEIGFDGLLMSDDMSMKALKGDLYDLSSRALTAGCDVVLHCNGDMEEMRHVARAAQPLSGDAERRALAAEAVLAPPRGSQAVAALRAEYDDLMARLG
ncbi:beta-N-acetylhexosaminidase [Aurantimonas sp. VKM B-3413]|uniref:beta-N-acetylhexosaminidase n=1 Tax=Aurantimonas sp. VKM B-3413 TaxID=2779401 RepID=UPI001E580E26|nr:beta-N-acetylhexosaminidase [Aurantimonas sp. VKM B-3413]MCB8836674.1 beta-N-acetylhexosaminidase [Aurantimonas sp. VKM B-3413]